MSMKLDVLFENSEYVIIDKPAGLLSIPDRHQADLPSVQGILKLHYEEVYTVHRLDRDTSGCIGFALNAGAHQYLSQLFEQRKVRKIYQCIVHGSPVADQGVIQKPISAHPVHKGKMMVTHTKGKDSVTEYTVLERFGKYSLLECVLHTGRTHQIRVHLADLGHPVVGDPLYGDGTPVYLSSIKRNFKLAMHKESETPLLHRLTLHATELEFNMSSDEKIATQAPLPKDMKAMLNQCRKWLR